MAKNYTDRELAIIRNRMGENIPVPPERKKRGNGESKMQILLCKWWSKACARFLIPETMLFSIPNGGRRDPIGVVFLKREGLRPGVCDLFLSVPRHDCHGLYIEMKAPNGVISEAQNHFILGAKMFGYHVAVCRSLDAAIGAITAYLAPP